MHHPCPGHLPRPLRPRIHAADLRPPDAGHRRPYAPGHWRRLPRSRHADGTEGGKGM